MIDKEATEQPEVASTADQVQQAPSNEQSKGSPEVKSQGAAPQTLSSITKQEVADAPKGGALEVTVDHNIERAMKVLKRKLIKEGLFKELKMRRYYEKPSERRKRKLKESLKKLRKEEARMRKNMQLYS